MPARRRNAQRLKREKQEKLRIHNECMDGWISGIEKMYTFAIFKHCRGMDIVKNNHDRCQFLDEIEGMSTRNLRTLKEGFERPVTMMEWPIGGSREFPKECEGWHEPFVKEIEHVLSTREEVAA